MKIPMWDNQNKRGKTSRNGQVKFLYDNTSVQIEEQKPKYFSRPLHMEKEDTAIAADAYAAKVYIWD